MKPNSLNQIAVISVMVVAAALCRVIPHPPNFSPIGAVALFGGACLANRWLAFGIPLLAMFISDQFLPSSPLFPVIYTSFLVNVALGRWLHGRRNVVNMAALTFLGAVQFFVLTNLAHWYSYYPLTLSGLTTCFAAAIPFFQNTLLGDACFATALFGTYALIQRAIAGSTETSLTAEDARS
ncbi:DUF6580 family putative transport protein [Planctomicrobium sp. SH668]|uniref:DUF6580 family putative transport protein n=1 Tax=Planctomicrobium sp. SH668 TaxID=3448126 RepID=UPI003F5B11CD